MRTALPLVVLSLGIALSAFAIAPLMTDEGTRSALLGAALALVLLAPVTGLLLQTALAEGRDRARSLALLLVLAAFTLLSYAQR